MKVTFSVIVDWPYLNTGCTKCNGLIIIFCPLLFKPAAIINIYSQLLFIHNLYVMYDAIHVSPYTTINHVVMHGLHDTRVVVIMPRWAEPRGIR